MTQQVAKPELFSEAVADLPLVEVKGSAPTVGFVLTWSAHIWYRIIISVMEARAAQYGATLLIEDTNSVEKQIEAIERMLDAGVGALVVVPAGERGYDEAVQMASRQRVPIIAESDPLQGAATLVAIDDYEAGGKLGRRIGESSAGDSGAAPQVLDVGLPAFSSCRNRSDGFLDGLRETWPEATWVDRVDGQADVMTSQRQATQAFLAHPEINMVFGIDDESAYGALRAWQELGRDESSLCVATFGLAGDAEKRRLAESPAFRAGLLMFPEYVAVLCLDSAIAAAEGASFPPRVTVPTVAVSADELERYYRPVGAHWLPDFCMIGRITAEPGEAVGL